MPEVITNNLDLWSSALLTKSSAGRGSNGKQEAYGIKKLRELILELAVRGKLVPQDPNDEPASVLLKRVSEANAQAIQKRNKKPSGNPEIADGESRFDLPPGWEYARNGSLFSLRKGKKPKDISESDIGLPYLDIEALDRGNVLRFTDDDTCPRATEEDILVVCDGSRSGLILDGKVGVIGSTLAVIDTPRMIQPFVKLLFMESYERFNSTMKGAAIPHLDTNRLLLEVVGLPPLNEQHRIVAKVDELMALCDQLEQQQTRSLEAHQTLVETLLGTLTRVASQQQLTEAWARIANHFETLFTTEYSIDQLKQTILQLAVMGKLVPQDHNDEPASVLLKRLFAARDLWLKECEEENPECATMLRKLGKLGAPKAPFPLPETWGCVHLIQVSLLLVDCHNKTAPYSEQGIPIIRTSNIRERSFWMGDIKFVSLDTYNYWSRRCPPAPGDIIFTREAPMGEAAIIPQGAQYCLGQRTMLIRPMHEYVSAGYLLLALTEPHLLERASEYAIGSTVKHLRVGDVESLNIPIPPLAEQHRIVAKVDELMGLCDTLKARIKNAQTTQLHLADAIVEQAASRGAPGMESEAESTSNRDEHALVNRVAAQ